jgi:hypothetical protein
VTNYCKETRVAQGETGVAVLVWGRQDFVRAGSAATIYPVATQTAYRSTDEAGDPLVSFLVMGGVRLPGGGDAGPLVSEFDAPLGRTAGGAD